MSHANPQFTKITFEAEDNIADVADELLAAIRDGLLKQATNNDTDEVVGPAAAAVEVHSRISYTDEPPTHIDPRDEIDDIESIANDIIRKYTDGLAQDAYKMDEDDRAVLLDVIAEVDAREGGEF